MAKPMLAKQMAGKKVVTNDGEDFGKVVDINVNEITGELEELVVEPNPESLLEEKLRKDEDGYVLIPYGAVIAVGDYVLVDKRVLLR